VGVVVVDGDEAFELGNAVIISVDVAFGDVLVEGAVSVAPGSCVTVLRRVAVISKYEEEDPGP
jgi:hypothetical protein